MRKSQLLLLCLFITTARVNAREVELSYENVRLTQYQQTSSHTSEPFYTIQAEQLNEQLGLQATLRSFNRAGASQKKQFRQGTLTLDRSEVRFRLAYFHRNQLIMNDCTGVINGTPFMAKEMVFDIENQQLLSPRVTFSQGSSIRAIMNFNTQATAS